jgi:hypothetical protein
VCIGRRSSRACRCRGARNASVADPRPALTDSSSSSSSPVGDLGLTISGGVTPLGDGASITDKIKRVCICLGGGISY